MKKGDPSALHRISLLLATTAATLGVTLGLPLRKAWAASFGLRTLPATTGQQRKMLKIIRPRYVNATAQRLLHIAAQALSNNALAERIFRDPDAVAKQYHLSRNETRVLRHMDRRQFQTARSDAARLVQSRLAEAGRTPLPAGATNALQITEGMIVGRAILAAAGRSYLENKAAAQCCPWSSSLELGVNSDPAFYNAVFQRPAPSVSVPVVQATRSGGRVKLPAIQAPRPAARSLPAIQAPRTGARSLPAVQAPRTGVAAPKTQIKVLRPGENRLK